MAEEVSENVNSETNVISDEELEERIRLLRQAAEERLAAEERQVIDDPKTMKGLGPTPELDARRVAALPRPWSGSLHALDQDTLSSLGSYRPTRPINQGGGYKRRKKRTRRKKSTRRKKRTRRNIYRKNTYKKNKMRTKKRNIKSRSKRRRNIVS